MILHQDTQTNDVMDAASYAADIFGCLLGMEAHVRDIEVRSDYLTNSLTVNLAVMVVPKN